MVRYMNIEMNSELLDCMPPNPTLISYLNNNYAQMTYTMLNVN